jgi:hypothetical protein
VLIVGIPQNLNFSNFVTVPLVKIFSLNHPDLLITRDYIRRVEEKYFNERCGYEVRKIQIFNGFVPEQIDSRVLRKFFNLH